MKKRLQRKWGRATVYVNDPRFFVRDDISIGALRAYAVYVPERKVGA
jgi:hypothetical protein